MRDVRTVLAEKEAAVIRLRKEVESLQAVIPLLAEDETVRIGDATEAQSISSQNRQLQNTGTEGPAAPDSSNSGSLWNKLRGR